MEQTELKERRYVGVRETLIYGVANGGQVIGYCNVDGEGITGLELHSAYPARPCR